METQQSEDLVKNSYILMVGYVVSTLISTLGTIFLIRYITPYEYSLLNIAYIIPAIIAVIGELGLNYASTHFIAKRLKENDNKGAKNIIKINLIVKTIFGIACTLTIIGLSLYIAEDIYGIDDERMGSLIQISCIGIISTILYNALISIYLGAQKVKVIQIGVILRTSLRTGMTIIFVLFGNTLFGPMFGFVFSTLIVAILMIVFLPGITKKKVSEKSPTDWSDFSRMMKYGYPLLIFSLIIAIQDQIFIFLLTISGYIIEVSYFSVAVVSAALVGILTKSVSKSIFPIFSKLDWNNEDERSELRSYYRFSIKFATLIIVPITVLIIMFSGIIFPTIYGEEYVAAQMYISLYFITFLFVAFGSLSIPNFLNGQKETRMVLFMELLKLISSIIISIILLPFYGAIAVVIGFVLGTFISVIYGNLVIRKKYGSRMFKKMNSILSICAIAILTGIPTYFLYLMTLNYISLVDLISTVIILGIACSFYVVAFLFLIGILAVVSEEEISFLVKNFDNFPILNKIVYYAGEIEKKIIRLRKK